jgi:hypothetical protein
MHTPPTNQEYFYEKLKILFLIKKIIRNILQIYSLDFLGQIKSGPN